MSYYAQFYNLYTRQDGSIGFEEAIADRSIIVLDGRLSQENKEAVARETAIKRGYKGFRIFRGTILRPFFINAGIVAV